MQHRVATLETRFTASGLDSIRAAGDEVVGVAARTAARASAATAAAQAKMTATAAVASRAVAKMVTDRANVDTVKASGGDALAVAEAERKARESRRSFAKARFDLKKEADAQVAQSLAAQQLIQDSARRTSEAKLKAIDDGVRSGKIESADAARQREEIRSVEAERNRAAAAEVERVKQIAVTVLAKAQADDRATAATLRAAGAERTAATATASRNAEVRRQEGILSRRAAAQARMKSAVDRFLDRAERVVPAAAPEARAARSEASMASSLLGRNVMGTPARVLQFAAAQGVLGLAVKGVGLGFRGVSLALHAITGASGFALGALEGMARGAFSVVGRVGSVVWGAAKAMASLVANIARAGSAFVIHLGSSVIRATFSTLTNIVSGFGRVLRGVLSTALKIGLALSALSTGGVIKLVQSSVGDTAKRATDLRERAASAGMSTTLLQAIEGQAKAAGSDPKDILAQVKTFVGNVAAAQRDPNGAVAQEFRRFGVDVVDRLSGRLRDPMDVLTQFAKEYGFARNQGQRTAMAQGLLGDASAATKDGRYWSGLGGKAAQNGASALFDTSYARQTGTFLSRYDLVMLQAYRISVSRVKDSWDGIKTSIARYVLPTVIQLARFASGFLQSYREVIAQFVAGRFNALVREGAAAVFIISREINLWRAAHGVIAQQGWQAPLLLKAYVLFNQYLRGPLTQAFSIAKSAASYLFVALAAVGSVVSNVAHDLRTLYDGSLDATLRYPWLSGLWDWGVKVIGIVQGLWKDLRTLYDGPLDADLRFPWLSGLWDWGVKVIGLVQRVWRDYKAMTSDRDGVVVEDLWFYVAWKWAVRLWDGIKSVARDLLNLTTGGDSTYTVENLWLYKAWMTAKELGQGLIWVGTVIGELFALSQGTQGSMSFPWLDTMFEIATRTRSVVSGLLSDVGKLASGSGAPMGVKVEGNEAVDNGDPFARQMAYLQAHRSQMIDYAKRAMADVWNVLSGADKGNASATTFVGRMAEDVKTLASWVDWAARKLADFAAQVAIVQGGGAGARGESAEYPWLSTIARGLDAISDAMGKFQSDTTAMYQTIGRVKDAIADFFATHVEESPLFVGLTAMLGAWRAAVAVVGNLSKLVKAQENAGAPAKAKAGSTVATTESTTAEVVGATKGEVGQAAGKARSVLPGAAPSAAVDSGAVEAVAEGGIVTRTLASVASKVPSLSRLAPILKPLNAVMSSPLGRIVSTGAAGFSAVDSAQKIGHDLGVIIDVMPGGLQDQQASRMEEIGGSIQDSYRAYRPKAGYDIALREQVRAQAFADRTVGMGDLAANRDAATNFVRKDTRFQERMAEFKLYFSPTDVVSGIAVQRELDALRRSGLFSMSPPTAAGGRS